MSAPARIPEDLVLAHGSASAPPAALVALARGLRASIDGRPVPAAEMMGISQPIYHAVLRGELITDWPFYARLTTALSVPQDTVMALHRSWQHAAAVTKREQPTRCVPLAAVPTKTAHGPQRTTRLRGEDTPHRQGPNQSEGSVARLSRRPVRGALASPRVAIEVTATNPVEFNQLMRTFLVRSSLRKNQLANAVEGMSRSQVYSLLHPDRQGLPTKLPQVISLLEACGAANNEITAMADLWRELLHSQPPIPTVAPAAGSTVVATSTTAPENTTTTVTPIGATIVPVAVPSTSAQSDKDAVLRSALEVLVDAHTQRTNGDRRAAEDTASTVVLLAGLAGSVILGLATAGMLADGSSPMTVAAGSATGYIGTLAGLRALKRWARTTKAEGPIVDRITTALKKISPDQRARLAPAALPRPKATP